MRRAPPARMSIARCESCGDLIDTDEDLDCYVLIEAARPLEQDRTVCVCGPCRQAAEEADQEAQAARTR